jgi:uncharacterized protein (DUF427 family)
MGLSWQQGPLAPAEPLRRRMRVRFAGSWIADSEAVMLLHEPGRYPVAYFPLGDIADGALEDGRPATSDRDLGATSWSTVHVGGQSKARAAWQHTELPEYAAELAGRAAFVWRAMDAFYEEDERIVGHAADPYHRIDIRPTSRRGGPRRRTGRCRHHSPAGAVRIGLRAPLVRSARRRGRLGGLAASSRSSRTRLR